MAKASKTVAQKMGIQSGWSAYFVGAPPGVLADMGLPDLDIRDALDEPGAELDYIHLFVINQDQMRRQFPTLVPHVAPHGKLWLSWPKSRQLGSDLTLPTVIEVGYDFGMVESTCLSVDAVWSALRFTHPQPGKTYRNSYGRLPSQRPPG